MTAARNRAGSAALVALYLAAAAAALPDEARRGALHYLVVASLGYGHLLGALRLRLPAPGPAAWLRAACVGLALANGLLLYEWAVALWPALVLWLLAVSVWHCAENDLALEAAYARGHRLGAFGGSTGAQLAGAGVTLLAIALAGGTLAPGKLGPALSASALVAAGPRLAAAGAACAGLLLLARRERCALGAALGAGGIALAAAGPPASLAFADVFAAATLHHLVSWLRLLADRARVLSWRNPRAARALRRRVGAAHAAPLLVLWSLPLAGPEAAALRAHLLAPSFYLFVSVLHVAQTLRARGRPA